MIIFLVKQKTFVFDKKTFFLIVLVDEMNANEEHKPFFIL
jgi:hypothetical protein